MARSILLVEDEPTTAAIEKAQLEQYGYAVTHVTSGEAAIEYLESAHPRVELILMDIDLGSGWDGPETAVRILQRHDIPIVFLSSHTEKEIVERTEQITSYGYVVKNSGITVLDASIKMAFRLFSESSRRRSAEAAATSRQRRLEIFERILEATQSGITIADARSPDMPIIYANPAFTEITGYETTEVLGRNCRFLQGKETRQPGLTVIREALATGKACRTTVRNYRKNGSPFWNQIAIAPVYDTGGRITHFVGIQHDMTEQTAADAALRRSTQQLEMALEASGQGAWLADWTTKTNLVDERWAAMLGYKLSEVPPSLGFWESHVHPDDLKTLYAEFDRHLRGEIPMLDVEVRARTKDGSWKWIADRARILTRDEQGQPLVMCGTHTDVTARRETEELMRRQMHEKEILLKETHHRIKNNLASIEGLLRLQHDAEANPDARSALAEAIGRVEGARIIYDTLLAQNSYEEALLPGYVEKLVRAITSIFPHGGKIRHTFEIDPVAIPVTLLQSAGLILNELVTNSMKYAFEKRDSGALRVSLRVLDPNLLMLVEDDGPGFPDGFDCNSADSLGMVIVRSLARQKGGSFSLERTESGSRAIVRLSMA